MKASLKIHQHYFNLDLFILLLKKNIYIGNWSLLEEKFY